jgi:surface protein
LVATWGAGFYIGGAELYVGGVLKESVDNPGSSSGSTIVTSAYTYSDGDVIKFQEIDGSIAHVDSVQVCKKYAMSDTTIQAAVAAWCSDSANATTTYGHIKYWDTSGVTSLNSLFYSYCSTKSSFNEDISGWNVSRVTDMSYMFYGATAFNSDVSSWDVSSVQNMEQMFRSASTFNSNVASWDVSSVQNMGQMFRSASAFNSNVSSWDVSRVTAMDSLFRSSPFNQAISAWNTGSVTHMGGMFMDNAAFNQDISSWDVSRVAVMELMFYGASSFSQDISAWSISSATTMESMFYGATRLFQALCWDISGVTTTTSMFTGSSGSVTGSNACDAEACVTWMDFGANGNINSEADLTTYGWTYYLSSINSASFYTSDDILQFFYFSTTDGYISQALPSGYDYLVAKWGAGYSDGGAELYVGGVLKESVDNPGSTSSSRMTSTAFSYSDGDVIRFQEYSGVVSIIHIDSIQVCRGALPVPTLVGSYTSSTVINKGIQVLYVESLGFAFAVSKLNELFWRRSILNSPPQLTHSPSSPFSPALDRGFIGLFGRHRRHDGPGQSFARWVRH